MSRLTALRARLANIRGIGAALRQVELGVSFAAIRASGLFDPAWYVAQYGRRRLPGHTLPLAHYVWRGRRAGYAPHPFFEPSWYSPNRWQDDPVDPFARFLLRGVVRGRVRKATPHPLFDAQVWADSHPEAVGHRFGPFGHFAATAGPQTLLPVAEPLTPGLTVAAARAGLAAALEAWQDGESLRRAPRLADAYDVSLAQATVARWSPVGLAADRSASSDEPLVSVVMPVRDRAGVVGDAIASVQAQTLRHWELVVVDDGSTDGTAEVLAGLAARDERIQVVTGPARGVCAARNTGAAQARGSYIAWLDSDNAWHHSFLATMLGAVQPGGLTHDGVPAAYAIAEVVYGDGRRRYRNLDGAARTLDLLAVANHIDLNVLVLKRELLDTVGGFDESLRRTVDYDLVWRVARRTLPRLVPFVGVGYRHDAGAADRITVTEPASWREVVKNRHLIDWGALASAVPDRDPNLTSVLVAASADGRGAWRTAASALETEPGAADLEVVVVDDQQPRGNSLALAALALVDQRVRVRRESKRVHRPLATNLALAASRGGTVVIATEGVSLWPGWLPALRTALPDHGAVQPLVVAADGTLASAGLVGAGDPEQPLAGLPVDDARRAARALGPGEVLPVRAVDGGVLAARAADVIAASGLDCLYGNGSALHPRELAELSLRLGEGRGTAATAGSTVGAPLADLPTPELDEERFAAAWAAHPDRDVPVDLWSAAGLNRRPEPREGRPALRWAIKIAAPVGPASRRWGDLHFARSLAAALERLGQQVVIDHRPAGSRDDRGLDDVVLVLRGLAAVPAPPRGTALLWVISHPDAVTPAETVGYHRIFAAGPQWAARFSEAVGRPVEPLLQATDSARVQPGGRGARQR